MSEFIFGTCSSKDGKVGKWKIDTFTISALEAFRYNALLNYQHDGNVNYLHVTAGRYKRLTHSERGVVMSNTPMEVKTCMDVWRRATGRVLINGLGLGMVPEALLHKPGITEIVIVELDADVTKLVKPNFKDKRIKIVQGDAYTYEPQGKFDYAWHDIWDTIDEDNLSFMDVLRKKYAKVAKRQGFWSRSQALAQKRKYAKSQLIGLGF